MTEEIKSRFLEDLWQSSDFTKKARLHYAVMWLDFAGDPSTWDKSLVIRFMQKLEKDGYSAGTRRLVFSVVKRVFDAATQPWPMGKRAAPEVSARDVEAPSLELDEAEAMITAATSGRLEVDEVAFLVLASVYGLRREELRRLDPDCFDFKKKTLFVPTAKHGLERTHLIPNEVLSYLKAYDWNKVYSLFDLSWMYQRIEKKSGVDHQYARGWHSFRRLLTTELLNKGLAYPLIFQFLRWKGGSLGMPGVYFSMDEQKADIEVFKLHPLLHLWR